MRNQRRVLVPSSMAAEGLALLAARSDVQVVRYEASVAQAALHALLGDAAAIALSWTRFGAAELAAAPHLEVVGRLGVGFDAVEVAALTARGVPLMTAGTANSRAVAEHAVHLIFALAKRSAEMHRRLRTGEGHDRLTGLPGEVAGKTVLVVGFGRIGSRTAPRCRALEMEVLVHDPLIDPKVVRDAGYTWVGDLDAGVARADYVTLHCPKTPMTVGMFGAERLARMKRGAFLINTARGGLVDEAALLAALDAGQVGGAGLDVFDPEPPQPDNPLLHRENVFASPHLAGVTTEAWAAIGIVTARNMLSVFDGAPLREHAVNPEVWPAA